MYKNKKDLISILDISKEDIYEIFNTAKAFKEIIQRDNKKVPSLRGKTIINLFYEPSTRTKCSFELAGKRLSADIINFSASTSSVKKGETMLDTANNLEAMKTDMIIVRHNQSQSVKFLAEHLSSSVINAGDGYNEHPTQALLDTYTLFELIDTFENKNVLLVGDIYHSRVAKSNIYCFQKLGANVSIAGPPTLMPRHIESLGVSVHYNIDEILPEQDFVIVLRVQFERHSGINFPSNREYSSLYGLNQERANRLKKDAIIMHPGPVNRGLEIDPDIADSDRSVVLEQVTNGVAVRMALLYLYSGLSAKVMKE